MPQEDQGKEGELVRMPSLLWCPAAWRPGPPQVMRPGLWWGWWAMNDAEWRRGRLPTEVTALGLGLPGDGIHDGILGVHADGRVVLRMDDGGLAAQPLHLDGLVGG